MAGASGLFEVTTAMVIPTPATTIAKMASAAIRRFTSPPSRSTVGPTPLLVVTRRDGADERTLEGVSTLRTGVAGVALTIAALSIAPIADAKPVWPSAGDQSASSTIDDLKAQGYDVGINWVAGDRNQPLSQCWVSAIHNPNRSAEPPTTFTTVYVDVSCPYDSDSDFDFGFGFGF